MRMCLCLLLCLIAAGTSFAQTFKPPSPVGQPARYSHIVAFDTLSVSMEAKSPTSVAVEEPILVHLKLQGRTAPQAAPTLEGLQPFAPEDVENFFVEPAPEESRVDPRGGQWVFGFRLRPKTTDVKILPMPDISYYSLARKDYENTLPLESEIKIDVKPRTATNEPSMALDIPAGWRTPMPASRFGWLAIASSGPASIAVVALAPPLMAAAVVLVWRRRFGVHAEGARFTHRSLQRVLSAVQESTTLDVGMAMMTDYLRDRLHWGCAQVTPNEVEDKLRRQGVDRNVCQQWGALYRRWDESRFGGQRDRLEDWRVSARTLLLKLEADPCVARLDGSR